MVDEQGMDELNRALSEFTKIPGIGLSKAKKLYEMGYKTVEDLKKASFDELANIKGIGPNRATLIKNYFAELAEKEKAELKAREEAKVEAKEEGAEVKAEAKPEAKEEAKVEAKEEGAEVKPEAKPEAKEEAKVEAKEEVAEVKPEAKEEAKPEAPEVKKEEAGVGVGVEPHPEKGKELTEAEKEIAEMEKELKEVEEVLVSPKGKEAKREVVFEKKVKKEGLINGLKLKAKPGMARKPKGMSKAQKVGAGFIVAILVFSSIFVLWYALQPSGKIRVDGSIDDWAGVVKYTDSTAVQNPDINIIEYSVLYENDRVDFYAKVSGRIFNGANNGYDVLTIFVDKDGNRNTGYAIENLGADAKIEVAGYDGQIRSASVSFFNSRSASAFPAMNYSAWENGGEARAECSASIVEGYAKIPGLSKPVSLFVLRHVANASVEEKRGMAYAGGAGSLVITQRFIAGDVFNESDNVLELKVVAKGGDVVLKSLAVSNAQISANFPLTLIANTEHTFTCTPKALEQGKAYAFAVESVLCDVPYRIVGNGGKAYFGGLPQEIVIDGAFGDWQGVQKGSDAIGDVGDKNIDLREYASRIESNAYFYMGVDGSMLAGCEIPVLQNRPGPPGPPPQPVSPVENLGKDIARVYIDLLNSTINTFMPHMIQHGYLIELEGRDGVVLSARAWHWEAGQRGDEITNASIVYGLSDGKIEFSVDLSALQGITADSKFYFEMSNWMGLKDASEVAYHVSYTIEPTRWWHDRAMAMFASAVDIYSGGDTDDIRCIAAGDLDLDGDIDFVTGDNGDDVDYWVNPGTNPFSAWTKNSVAQGLAGAQFIRSVALADLDNDGDLDVIASSNDNNDNGETWVIENQRGNPITWGNPRLIGTADYDRAGDMDVGDIDNDGWIDIAVVYRTANGQRLVIYKNDHTPFDSTWATYRDLTGDTGYDFWSVALADFDNDGDIDIAVGRADAGSTNNLYLYGNPSPSTAFSTGIWAVRDLGPGSGATTNEIVDLAVGDFDRDGGIDIVSMEGFVAGNANIDVWKNPKTGVFGTGTWVRNTVGTVQANNAVGVSEGIRDLTVADFDNDGWLDIGSGSEEAGNPGLMRVWENDHTPFSGTWYEHNLGNLGGSSDIFGVASADVDRDGDYEFVGSDVDNNLWLFNNTLIHRSMEFADGTNMSTTNLLVDMVVMVSGDLDNDGDADLITGSVNGRIEAWNNTENTTISAWQSWGTPTLIDDLADEIKSIAIGDLDRDGKLDIVVAEALGTDDAFIYAYQNVNPFTAGGWQNRQQLDQWNGGTNAPLALADFDRDGDLDVVSGDTGGNIGLFQNDGTPFNGGWGGWYNIYSGGSTMCGIAVADLDRDGYTDVISGDAAGVVRIHRCPANPFGTSPWSTTYTVATLTSAITQVKAGDLDLDGDIDISCSIASTTNQLNGWRNPFPSDPFGTAWGSTPSQSASGPVYAMDLGDLDNDKDLDCVAGDIYGNIYSFENPTVGGGSVVRTLIGNRTYNITTLLLANLDPRANAPDTIPSDLGDLDLVTADDGSSGTGSIYIWRNKGAMCTMNVTNTAPIAMPAGATDDVLSIAVTHNGFSPDRNIEIYTWTFMFYDQNGNPISAANLNTIFTAYQIYQESGVAVGWDAGDIFIPQKTGSPVVSDGKVTITVQDNAASIPSGTTNTYYLVLNRTSNAPPPGITHFYVRFDPDGYTSVSGNYMNQSAPVGVDRVATVSDSDISSTTQISLNETEKLPLWCIILVLCVYLGVSRKRNSKQRKQL